MTMQLKQAMLAAAMATVASMAAAQGPELAKMNATRVERTVRLPGEFAPQLRTAVYARVPSFVEQVHVDRGSAVRQGQVLIEQNAADRTVYIVEAGTLTVHYEDGKGRLRLASVEGGSAVGEGAFFTRNPRSATVQAASACKLWSLSPIRFTELSNRQPAIALELAMALGSLVSRRLANRPKRVAVT